MRRSEILKRISERLRLELKHNNVPEPHAHNILCEGPINILLEIESAFDIEWDAEGEIDRPDFPPKFIVKINPNQYTGQVSERTHHKMAAKWLAGISIEKIAVEYNVTRERVRQCIWKSYRESVDVRD